MLRTSSILTPVRDMPADEVLARKDEAILKLEALAMDRLGADTKLITRDLKPTDLGLTNEEWTDTTGSTDNTYENHIVAGGSTYTINNRVFVVIWGVRNYTPATGAGTQPITRLRITVGGSRVAEWNLMGVQMSHSPDTTETAVIRPIAAIADDPIFVEQNLELLLEQYVITTSAVFKMAIEGAVCEPSGLTLHI